MHRTCPTVLVGPLARRTANPLHGCKYLFLRAAKRDGGCCRGGAIEKPNAFAFNDKGWTFTGRDIWLGNR